VCRSRTRPGLWPAFDGRADVSADADLIADGTLIDIRSTLWVPTIMSVPWMGFSAAATEVADIARVA
jgi:hypothetical protein